MTLALSATYQPGDSTWPLLLENFVIDMDGMAEKIEKKWNLVGKTTLNRALDTICFLTKYVF